jgi:transposase
VVATPDPLPSEPDALRAIIAAQAAELAAKDAELRSERTLTEKLKAQLALLRRARFGASSEKIDRAIEQLELALDQIEAAELQETGKVLLVEKRAGSGRSARLPLPDHLPREEVVHAASCVCPECGSDRLRKSGEIVTEVLDYVPASFRVVRHVQPRHLCLTCDAVVTTAMPSLPIERGKPGPGLVAHVLVAKFCDHLPLYRQSEIYAREGVEIARSTLADWIGRAAWLMEPLVEAVRAHVFAGARLHGDDTPMPVLEPGRGQTKRGRLWTYVRDERPWQSPASPAVCYFYSADRKAMHPQAHLKGYSGVLHADAYAGFKDLYRARDGRSPIVEAACWAHARRKFFELTVSGAAPIAEEALRRIGDLYEIEASIRGSPPKVRLLLRQEQAKPKVEALRQWLERELARLPGKSATAQAIRYALSRWSALSRYLDDGTIEIDNNAAERSIRPVALGRKNWLFAGSDQGGERAAAILSLIETAKLNGVEPEARLRDVLARIADYPINRVSDLLPWNWKPHAEHSATSEAAGKEAGQLADRQ